MTKEERLDKLSFPLRKAVSVWANTHAAGCFSSWTGYCWVYEIGQNPKIFVDVAEDGSYATVWKDRFAVKCLAKTPRGLVRVLNRLAKVSK